jgi:hypothetical protein
MQVRVGMHALLLGFGGIFGAMGLDLADVAQRHLLTERREQGFDGRFAAGEGATLHLGFDLPLWT